MEIKTTLKEVPTGTIDIVFDGILTKLQFNCSCDDALPFCGAVCCRMRQLFNTTLSPDEVASGQYATREVKNDLHVLQSTVLGACVYLEGNRCGINATKPHMCKTWHCSPGGEPNNPQITIRSTGWMMTPA